MEYNELYDIATSKIKEHIKSIHGIINPMIMISNAYPGVWLEHVYDAVIYGDLFSDYSIAINTINTFIDLQNDKGAYPCFIKDIEGPGYSQIQECVSFITLGLYVYNKTHDMKLINKLYQSGKRYIDFIYKYRMTRGMGLPEAFVGYDTGHDNSARLDSYKYSGCYRVNGERISSDILPDKAYIAVDMSSNLYGNLSSLSRIAEILGIEEDKEKYYMMAEEVKKNIFKYLYDKETDFFYDLDSDNHFIYVKSSQIFHLFQEHVIVDKDMIDNIYHKYLMNKNEFNSSYPIPAVSLSDKSRDSHKMPNSWGYYSQALIALRCNLWMDSYGFKREYDNILSKWMEGFKRNYNSNPFSQELDPTTGESSGASLMYSSAILLYILAYKRLN
ncbi:MAG: hypothetical protein K6G48_01250 [Acholeplasmatales bacterium]|nr:hypothetical protein [Acholeplasmatales bacterium]